MKFAINIKETLEKTVIIEGVESAEEAVRVASDLYNDGEIVLDADNLSDKEIEPSEYYGSFAQVSDDADISYYDVYNSDGKVNN